MSAILARSVFGPMLVPPYDEYLAKAIIRNGEYCPAEFETWRRYLPLGASVVDIGANFGAHTIAFADQVGPRGRVLAVEPQWQLYAMLCGTAALNHAVNVRAKWCACGASEGTVRIPELDYLAPNNFGGLELGESEVRVGAARGETVARETVDSWRLSRVDFIKIDVEGMELDVLRGAYATIEACRPVLAVEADREDKVIGLYTWLRMNRYRLWWHRPKLGALWGNVVSQNLLCLPVEKDLPEPTGDVEPVKP